MGPPLAYSTSANSGRSSWLRRIGGGKRRSRRGSTLLLAVGVISFNFIVYRFLFANPPPASPKQSAVEKSLPKAPRAVLSEVPSGGGGLIPLVKPRSFKESSSNIVHFSAYQVAPNEFRAVGLSQEAGRTARQPGSCRWALPDTSGFDGTLSVAYPGEHHAKEYETFVAHCVLKQPVRLSLGGSLTVTLEDVEAAVYAAEPGAEADWVEPHAPFPTTLTYCGSPMYGLLDPQRVREWLSFHTHTHGIQAAWTMRWPQSSSLTWTRGAWT
eukprot:TRINITY_DN19387_c0_g1_i1.p2 TRINITY_DN19387_c0_g1~~TRINITY_DN19387_c0_g1_i1.p2  ORF type:complete len:269 (-),score=36.99 TRINITY_DN19387_c0_g1_i1:1284-2090(-)